MTTKVTAFSSGCCDLLFLTEHQISLLDEAGASLVDNLNCVFHPIHNRWPDSGPTYNDRQFVEALLNAPRNYHGNLHYKWIGRLYQDYTTDAERSLRLYYGQERYLHSVGALSLFEKTIDRLIAGEHFDDRYYTGGGFYKSLVGYYTRPDGYGGMELVECIANYDCTSYDIVVAVAF